MQKRAFLVALVAAFLGVAGAVMAAGDPGGQPTTTVAATEAATTPVAPVPSQGVDERQAAAFAILREPAAGAGGLPSGVTDSPGVTRVGGNAQLTRKATTSSGETLYVTPGTEGLCLGDGRQNTCGALDAAIGGYVIAVQLCGPGLAQGQTRVIGLATNGVKSVELATTSGTQALAIADNVYAGVAAGTPVGASFTDAGGAKHEIPLGAPGDLNCQAKG